MGASIGLAASTVLVVAHLRHLEVPGCGVGSGCAGAAAGRLGSIPLLGWPTSIVGAAFFAALLAAWCAGRPISRPLLWTSRLGAVAAIFLLGGMAGGGWFCSYCAAAHLGMFLTWSAAERAARSGFAARSWQPAALVGVGVAALVALVAASSLTRESGRAKAERNLADATAAIVRESATPVPPSAPKFEGRYRRGPEAAPVRLVLFTDYQCPDCRLIEAQVASLLAEGLPIAVSVKMFPFNRECNPNVPNAMHANACWAARAAEAAGIIAGPDGFWRMHAWLFARGGSFTDGELDAGLLELGFPRDPFIAAMTGPEVNARIAADVAEGMNLGLWQTPMIFINGVELKGWQAPQAVERAVRAALAASPAAATAANDLPPDAGAKMLADWHDAPRQSIAESDLRFSIGPDSGPVRVIVFGDYAEPSTAEADGLMRVFSGGANPTVRYSFVPFPVDPACNPFTQVRLGPASCPAALAAEAAAVLDGPEGFWRMHAWLMANRTSLSETAILDAASSLGFDRAALAEAMVQPFLREQIEINARLANRLGLKAIPMVIVDGRHAARWKWEAENVLGRIVMDAAAHAGHDH